MKTQKTAEAYISKHPEWKEALTTLRRIMLSASLSETIKWSLPVYTMDGKNIVGLGAFRSYAGIWFFQGALLKDKEKKLINAQEGTTKAQRQWRFGSVEEIDEKLVKTYVEEAIQNHKKGKEIKPVKSSSFDMPEELAKAFKQSPELRKSFEQFTFYKQKEFAEYINEVKGADTKAKRLEKIIPMISEGIGLHDKYRK